MISGILFLNKVSSDLLRKLLPSNDTNNKLKIQLANLEEISNMVFEEWEWMK